jgi:hypothetical protein
MENKTTNLYVVYQNAKGEFDSEVIEITGKVNVLTVTKELRKKLDKYDHDNNAINIISWQEVEEFTAFEMKEYWDNYDE